MNVRNTFRLCGQIPDTPVSEDHADGSRTIRFNISAKNNYTKRDGSETFETLPVAVFRSAAMMADPNKGPGIAGTLKAGDTVAVQGSVRNNNWTDTMGQPHYGLVLQIETLDIIT